VTDARRELGAGAADVIDHLLVDAPPCAPDEEREVPTLPMSPEALALKRALELLDGQLSLDFTDKNIAAIIELGGRIVLEPYRAGSGYLHASWKPENAYFDRVSAFHWGVDYVESRADAERNARLYPAEYAGWNEPPPAPKSAEQLEADAKQAAFEAAERAAVLAAERELATAYVPAKKDAA
jgi:hypothetical protein